MATRWQTHCPTCGCVVYHNHRCPGAVPDPPCPRPDNFWDLVEQARREAAADAQVAEPLTLPLEVDQ